MCGIAGFLNKSDKNNYSWFDGFLDSLSHRGPDGRGIWLSNDRALILGHRRLSILDISGAGSQPMVCGTSGMVIIYNGEIYNFLELRRELASFGYQFRSDTDTEVLLAAYDHWGEDCQKRLNGMWAFAIWDPRERKLFLSRDRFGVKPLFYLVTNDHFIFASELKAFRKLPGHLRPELDVGMIALGEIIESAKKTILQGVFNLNAGHQLVIHGNLKPVIRQWWKTSDNLELVTDNYSGQVDRFREMFLDSCRIRMRSDVPLGTALSGGMDSSAVICGLSNVLSNNPNVSDRSPSDWRKAFVLDYTGTPHSERKYAEEVINYVGADPIIQEINLRHIDPMELERAIVDFEGIQQPALGPWLVYREMRKRGIVVSIDGHGGDELLGGYFHYCHPAQMDALLSPFDGNRWLEMQAVHAGLHQAPDVPDGFQRIEPPTKMGVFFNDLKFRGRELTDKIFSRSGLIRSVARRCKGILLSKPVKNFWKVKAADPEYLKKERVEGFDRLNQALYDDFHAGMLPNILRNFDRLSMAHGVESRAPLLDWRLVTFAFSLPSSSKMGAGFTKRILRDAMTGLMPETIRIRKSKIGFASPMQQWLAGPLKTYVMDTSNSLSFRKNPIWDGAGLHSFICQAFKAGDYKSLENVWPLIQAGILIKNFSQAS
jgi:asparagine synthase (glutamine-hydrolysing)